MTKKKQTGATPRRYDEAFKQEALRLALRQRRPIRAIFSSTSSHCASVISS